MYYHASQTGDIKVLEPRISNHNIPFIYFSEKRENVLVYLSNAIEKYCKETGFAHSSKWHKWASYGFESDGTLRIDEYYPNALIDTYKGVSGYIYSAENVSVNEDRINISSAVTTSEPVVVENVEFIEDAYDEIIRAVKTGLIKIRRYEEQSDKMLRWIEKTIRNEYSEAENEPDYRHFFKAKFSFLNDNIFNGE